MAGLWAFAAVALLTLAGVITGYNVQLREALHLSNQGRYTADISLAQRAYEDREVYRARELLETYGPGTELGKFRGFEWYYLWRLCEPGNRVLKGHSGRITALVYHPGGSILASGSDDKTIRLWPLRDQASPLVMSDHTGPITGLAFNPKGNLLASTSADGSTRIWDVASGRAVKTLATQHACRSPCFSPDGASLLIVSDDSGDIMIWDVSSGTIKAILPFRPPPGDPMYTAEEVVAVSGFQALFGADSRRIFATNGRWSGITVWDVPSHRFSEVLEHTAVVRISHKSVSKP